MLAKLSRQEGNSCCVRRNIYQGIIPFLLCHQSIPLSTDQQGKVTCQFLGKLISAGADINEPNENGLSPLLLCCHHQVDPGHLVHTELITKSNIIIWCLTFPTEKVRYITINIPRSHLVDSCVNQNVQNSSQVYGRRNGCWLWIYGFRGMPRTALLGPQSAHCRCQIIFKGFDWLNQTHY